MWKQARQRRLAGRSWRTTAPCVLSDSQPRTFPRLSVRLCSCPAPFLKLPSVWSLCFLFHFLLLPSSPSRPPSLAFSPSLIWSLWPVAASAPFSVLTLFYWRLSSFTCSCNMCNILCREEGRMLTSSALLLCLPANGLKSVFSLILNVIFHVFILGI